MIDDEAIDPPVRRLAVYNIPEKFTEFRPVQLPALQTLCQSEFRTSLLQAPTGAGKSLIYFVLAQVTHGRTVVCVTTKALQDQLEKDFSTISSVLKGKKNYWCRVQEAMADHPPCYTGGNPCEFMVGGCDYYDAEHQARHSKIVVINYAKLMSSYHKLGEFELLIGDEAQSIHDCVTSHHSFSFTDRDLSRNNLERPLNSFDAEVDWYPIECDALQHWLGNTIGSLECQLSIDDDDDDQIKDLIKDIKKLREETSTPWIYKLERGIHTFSPVWPGEFVSSVLLRDIPRVVLVSATMPRNIDSYLGLDDESYNRVSIDEWFPIESRILTVVPTVSVNYKTTLGDYNRLVRMVDVIISARLDRKTIIHTVSYDLARKIIQRSDHRSIMITHNRSTTALAVEKFRESDAPCVLVSPAVGKGYDFPFDECRCQIILKIPFLYSGDPLTKVRLRRHPDYIMDIASSNLRQMHGRAIRDISDWCETFLLDSSWLWAKQKLKFPLEYRAAIRILKEVPKPIKM